MAIPAHALRQMMENLLLQEGDVVTLRSATLPKGSFVKLQACRCAACRLLPACCLRHSRAGAGAWPAVSPATAWAA